MGHLLTPGVRKMQIVGMKMNDIEIFSPAENVLDHQHMVRQRIHTIRIQPQRPLAAFHQFRVRYRIAAGKQSDIMAEANQLFGQP